MRSDEPDAADIELSGQAGRPRGGVRELLVIALPMVVSHASETVMTFTDRMFLSRLSPTHMNAAFGGGLTCFLMMTFFMGLIGYTTALVAQYLGAGRTGRCAVAATQAGLICVAAYPLILLALPLVYLGYDHSHIAPEQLALQKTYLGILVLATPVGLIRHSICCFFSGIGKTRVVMLASMASMVVNIFMNWVLIFGHLGFPALGIRGAAYGTITGGAVGLVVVVWVYFGRTNRGRFGVMRSLRFDREAMGKLLRFGYPAGIEMLLNVLAFTGLILTFHAHGPATATAVTVLFNWDMVSFVPLIGIQIGVTSLVGRYMGAGQPDIAHRATLSGLKCGWAFSVFVLAAFALLPHYLVRMFLPDAAGAHAAEAAPMAVTMIRLASIYVMVEAVAVVFSGALRGAGDTFWAMCISVTIHWSLLPIPLVMLHVLGLRPETAWLVLVVAFLGFSSAFYVRYRTGKWREIRVVPDETELLATDHDQDFHEPVDL